MAKYDAQLMLKIGHRINKKPDYIREQISKRALNHNVSPEAELANWARSLKISADKYIRNLPPNQQAQIYSRPEPNLNRPNSTTNFRIIKIKGKENEWYNQWWIQWFIVGIIVATIAGTLSQIIGAYFTNLFGLTNP